jgi:predicted Holliday junction resolvase-like endonuclease
VEPLSVVLLLCVAAGAIVATVFAIRFAALQRSIDSRVQANAEQRLQQWRARELEGVRQQYQGDLERLQQQYQALVKTSAETTFNEWKLVYEREIRQDAIDRSKAVIVGKVTEHVIPYLPEFRFNPKDARFVGSPVDFVVFDGLDEGVVRSVVFVEVKTGKSALNGRERAVREAIKARRVEWCEIRVGAPALAGE